MGSTTGIYLPHPPPARGGAAGPVLLRKPPMFLRDPGNPGPLEIKKKMLGCNSLWNVLIKKQVFLQPVHLPAVYDKRRAFTVHCKSKVSRQRDFSF